MSAFSHYSQGSSALTVGAVATGYYDLFALDLDKKDATWERAAGVLPISHTYEEALAALQAWATAQKLPRADCPVGCWYLEQQRTMCGFFFQDVDTRCGYALPLRCEKCRRFGSIPS